MKRRAIGLLVVAAILVWVGARWWVPAPQITPAGKISAATTFEPMPLEVGTLPHSTFAAEAVKNAAPATPLPPCSDQKEDETFTLDLDPYEELSLEMARDVLQSDDAQHKLVGLQLQRDVTSEYVSALVRLVDDLPHNPLLATTLFSACDVENRSAECDSFDTQAHLMTIDGDNGGAWLRIASNHLVAGRTEDALQALKQVADAPRHTNYYIDWVVLTERVLRSVPNVDRKARFIYGFGVGGKELPGYHSIVTACMEQGATSASWRHAWISAGASMEQRSSDLMGTIIGIAVQRIAYETNEQPELADAAQARRVQHQMRQKEVGRWSVERFWASDPAAFQTYVDTWSAEGEVAAMDYAVEAASRAAARGEHIPCSISDPDLQ